MPMNHPEESIQYSESGESLKSRKIIILINCAYKLGVSNGNTLNSWYSDGYLLLMHGTWQTNLMVFNSHYFTIMWRKAVGQKPVACLFHAISATQDLWIINYCYNLRTISYIYRNIPHHSSVPSHNTTTV
jgi:hypothetical protein